MTKKTMLYLGWVFALVLSTATLAKDQPAQEPTGPSVPASPTTAQSPPQQPDLSQIIQRGDRVLFLGDELTQQMFYTRAVAAGLLAMRPQDDLRFFNGGRDGATVQSTEQSVDTLLDLCRPTVVFVCLGLNDCQLSRDAAGLAPETFQENLGRLTIKLKAFGSVRQIIILSPPPITKQLTEPLLASSTNGRLYRLGQAARQAADEQHTVFIDLFDPMKQVYLSADHAGGKPLTHNNRLPTEMGHVALASIILKGIGATTRQLEPVGWSPLRLRQMHRIRQALALPLKPPDFKAAQKSRDLYDSIQRFDEAFFRLWRLSGRNPSRYPKEAQLAAMQRAWADVDTLVQRYRQ